MQLPQKMINALIRLAFALLVLSTAACGFRSYRIDIQQGNVVTPEQYAQLRVGMTSDQVRFLLGTPILTDVFHDKRWDYLYWMDLGATREVTARSLVIHFNAEGKVESIVADEAFRAQKVEEGSGNKVFEISPPLVRPAAAS